MFVVVSDAIPPVCAEKKRFEHRPESKSENAPNFESHKETQERESIKKT